MPKLYGISSGCRIMTLMGPQNIFFNSPSRDFIAHLTRLPKNSKVGLGIVSGLPKEEEAADFNKGLADFWQSIYEASSNAGHCVLYIGDAECSCRYTELQNKHQSLLEEARAQASSFLHRRMSLRDSLKVAKLHEEMYFMNLALNRVNHIERKDALVKRIESEQFDAVVLPKHFADALMIEQERGGIETFFTSYSNDFVDEEECTGSRNIGLIFRENAIPCKKARASHAQLMRAVSFSEKGTFDTKRKADFVGTWDPLEPSRGYFELSLNLESAPIYTGTVEDCYGSASFSLGTFGDEEISFTKQYSEELRGIRGGIFYNLKRYKDNIYSGSYSSDRCSGPVVMIRASRANPLDLTLAWYKAEEENSRKRD